MEKKATLESNAIESKYVIHRANERGSADHGWLKVNHSFSFAQYHNPEKVHFGALRVLNDDYIAPNQGFPSHPHNNMEIITIPLEGELSHKDSMGNASVIKAGEIQVMSAGKGVIHSEFNSSQKETTNLFQIWIFPNKKDVQPRYDQMPIEYDKMNNSFLQLVSPNQEDEGSWIYQDAWIKMGRFDAGQQFDYKLNNTNSGLYLMVVEGSLHFNGEKLEQRDAIGIWDVDKVSFDAGESVRLLTLEVPMEFNI